MEPKSDTERRLAHVVLREVLNKQQQRRDPEELVTTKFLREALDDECEAAVRTVPFELPLEQRDIVESTPYELVEVIVPVDDLDTIPFDLIEEEEASELCASSNLVAMDIDDAPAPLPLPLPLPLQLPLPPPPRARSRLRTQHMHRRSSPRFVSVGLMLAALGLGFGVGMAVFIAL